ncbi:MAG: quinolinate synthase NadA [Oligoflexia bacterium]|nr:quinolinate synthase NadA [Oligoflexia bacterium]
MSSFDFKSAISDQSMDEQKALIESFSNISDEEVMIRIASLKQELSAKLIILGHHYQQAEIIQFADIIGDSLFLAQKAASIEKEFIIFCGVHFMAETADILAKPMQKVILPDLGAGCSMADMANIIEVESAWKKIHEVLPAGEKVIPITYVNSAADLKAFVGKHHGYVCTSSNAERVIAKAFEEGSKILFFPDQHLGRNTCYKMGIPLEQMVLYPHPRGGSGSGSDLHFTLDQKIKVILWEGYCSVHQGFTKEQILQLRKESPHTKVIVHPECNFEVVQMADQSGSTAFIVEVISKASSGSSFAVGTEINLVSRLAKLYPDKEIRSLSPFQCLCSTMYRVHPRALLASLTSIKNGRSINVIKVNEEVKTLSKLALNRMLQLG